MKQELRSGMLCILFGHSPDMHGHAFDGHVVELDRKDSGLGDGDVKCIGWHTNPPTKVLHNEIPFTLLFEENYLRPICDPDAVVQEREEAKA